MMSTMRSVAAFAALLFLPLLSAAAPDVDAELSGRVSDYWNAVEQGDWETAYGLELAAQGEDALSAFEYYRQKAAQASMASPRILSVEQQGKTAEAVLLVQVVIPMRPSPFLVPKYYRSHWEKRDGAWFHAKTEPTSPPAAATNQAIDGQQPGTSPNKEGTGGED